MAQLQLRAPNRVRLRIISCMLLATESSARGLQYQSSCVGQIDTRLRGPDIYRSTAWWVDSTPRYGYDPVRRCHE